MLDRSIQRLVASWIGLVRAGNRHFDIGAPVTFGLLILMTVGLFTCTTPGGDGPSQSDSLSPASNVQSVPTLSSPQRATPDAPAEPTRFPARALPASSCEAPCWIGITPGKTPITDALALLGKPDESHEDYFLAPSGTSTLLWGEVIVRSAGRLHVEEQVALTAEAGVVRGISLADPNSRTTLADVVAKNGPPEYVFLGMLGPEAPNWHAVLLYPSKGMTFSSAYNELRPNDPYPSVGRSDIVVYRNYYEPTTIDQVWQNYYGQKYRAAFTQQWSEWKEIPD